MTRHIRASFVVALALIIVSLGCEKQQQPPPAKLLATPTVVTLAVDTNSNPTSCYASNAWPPIPTNDTNATIDWTANQGDANTYYITFTTNPLLDRSGHPPTMPIAVTSGGTSGGPYKLSSSAVSGCTGSQCGERVLCSL